ncbi:MAG: sensor histidine kinase [Deltaproteobacteria bacterium]|nr:sensor histidine kinase [Deltaproteobacteria bacterium]
MKRLGIRRKALVTLLGVAVPSLIAFSMLIIVSTAHILQGNASRQVSSLAERSATGLAEMVGHSQTTLATMAASPEVGDYLEALGSVSQTRLAGSLRRLEGAFLGWQKLDATIQAIRLIDPAGNVLVKIKEGRLVPATGPERPPYSMPAVHSVAGRDFFQAALRLPRNGVLISNLERGKIEEEDALCPAMVRFATPLFGRDGVQRGVLVVNVWGEQAGRLINRLIAAEQGSAFLVERNPADNRRNGIYLFHRDGSCEFGDQTGSRRTIFDDYPPEITSAWLTSERGIASDPRSRDILAHAYYSPYGRQDRGWVVVVNARRDFFLGPLATIGRQTALWATLVLGLALAASLFFARSLTRPIQAVVEGIRRMGNNPAERIAEGSRDEVGFLAGEINRMADAIQQSAEERLRVEERIRGTEKLASIGEMAAGLAHELNTPLGNIKALAILARKGIERGECDRRSLTGDLDDIADQAGKCSGIIAGLLSFARRSGATPAPHDPAVIMGEALALVRLRAENRQVRLSCDDAPLPSLLIDGDQLRQVFVNILLNGIDAAPGGEVAVTLRQRDGGVQASFRDNGCGIAPEHLDRIFDPFFTTKEVGEGTGLGLSVSYGMINGMGGDIEVESRPGEGACFKVFIPGTREVGA